MAYWGPPRGVVVGLGLLSQVWWFGGVPSACLTVAVAGVVTYRWAVDSRTPF